MKVGEPDEKQIMHMIGSFNFAPELESRCMKTRFENYSRNMDFPAGYWGDHGWLTLSYNNGKGDPETSAMFISLNSKNDSIINIRYNDYDHSRYPIFADCQYTMVKDDSFIGMLEGAGTLKICLAIVVLIIGLGFACKKNVYKVTPMEVQEEDGIQKYQAPQQIIQQQQNQPENVL